MRRSFALRVLSGALILGLVGAIAVPAIAEEAAGAAAEEAAAEETAAVDTRLGNAIGFGTEGGTSLDNYAEYTEKVDFGERLEGNAEANESKRYTDALGNTYQPVPDDSTGWNISYLNADERGCLSCHTRASRTS